MKVKNMQSSRGNFVPNQFIITDRSKRIFQNYNSVIAIIESGVVTLDERYWNYSVTTGRYRNQFLGENKKETQSKIDLGIYKLANLN